MEFNIDPELSVEENLKVLCSSLESENPQYAEILRNNISTLLTGEEKVKIRENFNNSVITSIEELMEEPDD